MRVIARVFRNARNMLSLDQIDRANLSSQVFLCLKTRDKSYVLVERYHVAQFLHSNAAREWLKYRRTAKIQ